MDNLTTDPAISLAVPPELPIAAWQEEIVAQINASPVVIIAGEPGSGKTTQIPKFCLLAGRGQHQRIGCTQPRRLAAVAMAERLAVELGGDSPPVGHRVRFSDHTDRATRVKFMTDGILLAEVQRDGELREYDTIIVDEAHERTLNIDFLLGILKDLLARRDDLRVIITSATIDTAKFSRHFDDAPVIEVSGRAHSVEVRYQPWDEAAGEDPGHVERAATAVEEILTTKADGDILVFMPTERDIRETVELINSRPTAPRRGGKTVVLPLYGRLSPAEQARIFRPVKGRKVVVATNVAETSITVPGIRYVVDSGLARIAAYNPRARTHKLPVVPVARSSCDQRAGRCGRVGPGICIRLYHEEDYLDRPLYTPPEIVRSNLAEVILRMVSLKLGRPDTFPFVDPPSSRAISDGYQLLTELGAVAPAPRRGPQKGRPPLKLTSRGRLMARLPLDPCISRMIIEARENNALSEVCVIAAALSIQDPRLRPADKEKEADEVHGRFAVPGSDFLFYVKLWETSREVLGRTGSLGRLRKFCAGHFLSFQRLREWQDIHEQIRRILKAERGFSFNQTPAEAAAVHRALLSGNLRNIAMKKEKHFYQGGGGRQLLIFPGSTLFNKPPPWLMAAELVETGRLYARTVAAIEPEWVEPLAGELMRYSYSNPHWEKRRGQAVALERGTLFGLPVVVGRKVPLARVDAAEARRLFIQQALIEGELRGDYDFLRANQELVRQLAELEERSRRRDLLVDEEEIFNFYDRRLPAEVCDQAGLNRLLKKQRGDDFLRLRQEDLIQRSPDDDLPEKFPTTLQIGELELALRYRFEPGAADDGVTVQVPVRLAGHLRPEPFEWLVPGMLEEKVFFLLKNLPKNLRRPLVPIPQTAAELTRALLRRRAAATGPVESLYQALGREIYDSYGLRLAGSAWPRAALPEHLRCRFCLLADDGRELAAGRELAVLNRETGAAGAPPEAAIDAMRQRYERLIPNPAALPELPTRLPLSDDHGQLLAYLFPGLCMEEEQIRLRLYQRREDARRDTGQVLLSLYRQEFPRQLKMLRQDCRPDRQQWLLYEGLGAWAELERRFDEFMLREIFALHDPQVVSAAAFAANVARVREAGLYNQGSQLFARLQEVCRQRRRVLDTLQRLGGGGEPANKQGSRKIKGLAAGLAAATGGTAGAGGKGAAAALPAEHLANFRRRLAELVEPDFPANCRAEELPRLARYLQGLAVRVERAYAVPARESAKAAQLAPFRQRLTEFPQAAASPAQQELLAEYRRMLAEYEISLFAQEIGTEFPISPQRLEEKWREIERAPHGR
ncbi:MAG: ATP-dependent RNA helicase HrpA [Desulfurivibrio sp.]|nr:ATP-dependent RNA helicase HrpA [Desulfurivibrio sp.]